MTRKRKMAPWERRNRNHAALVDGLVKADAKLAHAVAAERARCAKVARNCARSSKEMAQDKQVDRIYKCGFNAACEEIAQAIERGEA